MKSELKNASLEQRLDYAGAIKASLRVLEGKWKIIIINELLNAKEMTLRFSELERQVSGVTQKVLIQQLKELEKDGIILRTVYPQVPPKVEYSLTDLGAKLENSMDELIKWAKLRFKKMGLQFDPSQCKDSHRPKKPSK